MSVTINPTVYHNGGHVTLDPSSSGLHGGSAQWQPPLPSMAALPVDMSKTEPKPAYYKLQFGDDYTGFSYYEKPIQVPPPDITSPQVPARPPLDTDQKEYDDLQDGERMLVEDGEGMELGNANDMGSLGEMDSQAMAELLGGDLFDAAVTGDVIEVGPLETADPSSITLTESNDPMAILPTSDTALGLQNISLPSESVNEVDTSSGPPQHSTPGPEIANDIDVKLEQGFDDPAAEATEAIPAMLHTPLAAAEDSVHFDHSHDHDLQYEHDLAPSDAEIIHAMLGPPPPPPPPPPPGKSTAPVDHVDVDLGPLKSVSRNHAKIEFRPELGHFCLEIHGRNGAWVDDRYYVKGSAVPLYQGSVIQIATRIFSFILPPSPGGSPATPHVLDASFDSNSPLDDVPYPYNLPASQVGYQEFFGESMPGPGPTTIAQQVPQPFNAFTAPDGQGLGLGMEYDWSQDKRKGRHHWTEEWSSEDSEDSWDSWDESDEVEERRNVRPRRRVEEGESELSSLEDESEEEEDYDEEDDVEDEEKEMEVRVEEDERMAEENQPVKEEPLPEDPAKHKKKSGPKSAGVSNNQVQLPPTDEMKVEEDSVPNAARVGKGPAKSGKLPAKSVKAVKALKAQLSKSKSVAMDTEHAEGSNGNVEDQVEVKKGKKVKADKITDVSATGSVVEDGAKVEKAKPAPKKAGPKKAKAVASQTTSNVPGPPPAQAVSTIPVARPPAPPQAVVPTPTPAAAPVQPPITTLAAALAAAAPPPRPPPVTLIPAPVPTALRPPPVPTLANQTAVRPPAPTPVRPPVPVRPPAQAVIPPTPPRPAPIHAISAQESTSASSPTGTPEPQKPFYLTELIETPGRPGHIIVNVPIPPSGAGPRPPPGPLIGLDGETFIGPPPIKPTATFAIIIYSALANLPRGRGTLGEVCNWIAGEWEWFRLNVDTGWQNSIRHNLSLNKAFLKVPRIPEDDPESKGSVWIIDPKEGPLFEEKQRKEAQKSEGKTRTAEMRAVRERQKIDERVRMQKEGLIPPSPTPSVASPAPARPPPPARVPVNTVRPVARPPAAPPVPKGPVLPKGKVLVSFGNITPAMRAESLIQTLDSNGNPMPFVCSNTHLVLERTAFGHLEPDIIGKLQMLGAQVAVDVLLGWVTNKNKQQAAKAAQAKAASASAAAAAPARPPVRPNGNVKHVRPPPRPAAVNGSSASSVPKATPAATAPPAIRPATTPSTIAAPASAPAPAPTAPPASSTSATAASTPKVTTSGGTSISRAAMRKIVSLIASAAAGNKDVSRVGPHASALLEYIKVVGAGIDLQTAEIIWTTGVMPPSKKAALNSARVNGGMKKAGVPTGTGQIVNRSPALAKPALKPSPSPSLAPSPTPSATTNLATISPVTALMAQTPPPVVPATPLPPAAVSPVAKTAPSPAADIAPAGVKRKLEDEPVLVNGGVPAAMTAESEAKRPKVEVGTG